VLYKAQHYAFSEGELMCIKSCHALENVSTECPVLLASKLQCT